MFWKRHSGKAVGEQSRGWSGGSTEDREAQRMAVCNGCADIEAQRTAVQTEGPRGRDQLAACRLALSEWDSSD